MESKSDKLGKILLVANTTLIGTDGRCNLFTVTDNGPLVESATSLSCCGGGCGDRPGAWSRGRRGRYRSSHCRGSVQ